MDDPVPGLAALFSLSRDAVIGVRKAIIVFMNPAAIEKAGSDSTGKPALLILPEHILNVTAETFVSSGVIFDQNAAVSVSVLNDIRVYMLHFEPEPLSNDADAYLIAPMRTLITNIKLAVERLSAFTEEYGDEKLMTCTSVLEHSHNQLRRLLLNLSVVNAVNKGEIPWLPVTIELKAFCAGLVEAAAFFGEKRGISVTFECGLKSCFAVVDRELFEQMFLNLLSNSLISLEKGGRVKVTLSKSGNRLILMIQDNGPGIPPEILSTVFCRWRENKTLVETASGAGIGLSVARCIAERHCGSIVIESRQGQGTKVIVMLPEDNESYTVFRSMETPYSLDSLDPVMVQLSTWLHASEYGPALND